MLRVCLHALEIDVTAGGQIILARPPRPWHASDVMSRWSRHPIFVLLLGALLALGLSLSAIQASDMAAKMATVSDMGDMAAQTGCESCGDDSTASGTACLSVCAAPVIAIGSPPVPALSAPTSGHVSHRYFFSLGRTVAPDPRPPRSSALG